jgi:paxillin
MGKDWHPHCFACHKCNKPLGPNNYLEKGGKPYCEDDYHRLFSPKCAACNEPIKDKVKIFSIANKNFFIFRYHLKF